MFFRNILDMIHTDLRWILIIIFAVIIFINTSGRIQIDALFDTTPQENINKFVNSIENVNPNYTVDGEATGVPLYDQNRLTYNMMYEMGHKDYFVYVFSKNISTDSLMNNAVEGILSAESKPKIYGISSTDLIGTYDEIYIDMAPVLLKLERDNSEKGSKPTVSVQNIYTLDTMPSLYSSLGLSEEVLSGSTSTSIKDETKANPDESDKSEGKESKESIKDNNEESIGFFESIKNILFKDGELR